MANRRSHHGPQPAPAARQRGLALLTAVFVVAMVAAAAASLSFGQQVWQRQVQNMMDRALSESLRQSALSYVVVLLADDARQSDTDDLTEDWAFGADREPVEVPIDGFAEGRLAGYIIDAQGRFNLNNLVDANGAPSQKQIDVFRSLLESLELDPNLAEAVVDWIDRDGDQRSYGAEDLAYLSKDPPYRAANQRLQSVEELRLIAGFNPDDEAERERLDTLREEHLTVLPVHDSKININTTTPEVLSAIYGNKLPMATAREIVGEVKDTPYEKTDELTKRVQTGLKNALLVEFDVKTDYFEVAVITQVGRLLRWSYALIHRPKSGATTLAWQSQKIVIKGIVSDESE